MTILRILCVHGDESVVETLGRALQTAGYEVILVTDGVTALRILARERVDAIVLDYEMEAPDRPSLRNQIHRLHPNVPMLLFFGCERNRQMPLQVFWVYLEHPEVLALALMD